MQLTEELHKKIMKQGKNVFEILSQYDKTREWPIGRARIDITLSKRTIQKLKKIKEKTGKPVSHIIEEVLENLAE